MPNLTVRAARLTTLFVIWALGLTTWVTVRVFSEIPPDIPMGTVTAFATLFALPAAGFGLWKWRNTDDG